MKRLTIDKNNAIKEHGKMADWNHLFFVRDRGSSVGSINGTKISNKWKYSIVIHITGEVIEKRAGSTLEGAVEKFKVELKLGIDATVTPVNNRKRKLTNLKPETIAIVRDIVKKLGL